MPKIPWKCVRYCWSALSSTIPRKDFWQPVPGAVCEWKPKLQQLLESYQECNKILQDNIQKVHIRIGVDGTNMWKANLETITYSFAEDQLCFNADAVHLLGIYVGKEIGSTLKKVNFIKNLFANYFNDIPEEVEIEIKGRKYNVEI